MSKKLQIKLQSYDYRLLDKTSCDVLEVLRSSGADVNGPIPLPNKMTSFCVLRGPHVHKKSREHFAKTVHSRLVILCDYSQNAVDALMGMSLPAGVSAKIPDVTTRKRG